MKLSVIMPVYNAAATLGRSLESIKAQTFKDFEVVFVDDCSADETSQMLEEFKESSGIPCKIVRHAVNQGVAAARNTALEAAEGEYLAFVDADDVIEPNAFEVALESAADIVGWDWTLGFEKNGRYMRQADYSTPMEAVKNLMGGTMRWNLWLFIYRRELIESHNIRFTPGDNMGEDMMFTISAFLVANKVKQIHQSLYNYNAVNTSSISKQFTQQRRNEVEANFKKVEALATSDELKPYLEYLKLFIKLPLLISDDKSNYEIWYNWLPESNAYAMANKALPLRTRLLQWMASKRFFVGVKFYYIFVYKFVYGIIYK